MKVRLMISSQVLLFTVHTSNIHRQSFFGYKNHARVYTLLPNLKALVRDNEPPFYKENLISHLYEINGADEDATCIQLGPLDIICLPSEITLASKTPARGIETGQTSTTIDNDPMQELIM